MTSTAPTSYDEVPYLSKPIPQTHPDRLATVALLFGMKAPALATCRVLELGCAAGGNLLPLAVSFPDGHFVGVDLSQRQVAMGQETIDALGLDNIRLEQRSILDVGPEFGEFDYILCHGVFSWVPAAVQEKILAICKRNLAPNGIAYVSYNTYPGWHMHRMIREVLCYHAGHFREPERRIAEARAFLDFLAGAVPQENNPYGLLLKNELEFLRQREDWYFFHEFLEEVNEPIYFHQFAGRAAAAGLQYVGEAEVTMMTVGTVAPNIEQVLRKLASDLIHLQQYLDFLRNTQFRQSLLCHDGIRLDRLRRPESLTAFQVASPARPVAAQPDVRSTAVEQFKGPQGSLSTNEPLTKTAIMVLIECWPQSRSFEELGAAVWQRLYPQGGPSEVARAEGMQQLAARLLNGYTSTKLVELRMGPPRCVVEVSARPVACPLARHQASTGALVTNRRHEARGLEEVNRQLLCLLDGRNDHAALLEQMLGWAEAGKLTVQAEGQKVTEAARLRAMLEQTLKVQLEVFARSALLVA
jgi:methyltransferase-like protein/SAM-dependent methyltransferase